MSKKDKNSKDKKNKPGQGQRSIFFRDMTAERHFQTQMTKALKLGQEKRFPDALEVLEPLREKYSDRTDFFELLGVVEYSLEDFDEASLYLPHATSLRMGDLGYTSKAQAGLFISYNSLEEYTDALYKAIKTPYEPYEHFATADGSPAQVNSNILQMEAEFYSTIRPKRIPGPDERPVHALRKHGVEYIEVRCLDLNPFLPVGIDEDVMYFLNSFLLYCVLQPSPPTSREEYAEIDSNIKAVVRRGREPGLELKNGGMPVTLHRRG